MIQYSISSLKSDFNELNIEVRLQRVKFMRKEPFTVGNFVHIYNRGNRKLSIVRDESDKCYFIHALYYFNTEITPENPFQSLRESGVSLKSDFNELNLIWPEDWQPRKPIVKILAYILLENHFHLVLKEIKDGGVTTLMRRIGTGMTNRFNTKYKETGRLFQGAYKAKCLDNDNYLKYILVYIQIKNAFEMFPGGVKKAIENFDLAYNWAIKYSYNSLSNYANTGNTQIIDKDIIKDFFPKPNDFKEFAKECMFNLDLENELKGLTFEN